MATRGLRANVTKTRIIWRLTCIHHIWDRLGKFSRWWLETTNFSHFWQPEGKSFTILAQHQITSEYSWKNILRTMHVADSVINIPDDGQKPPISVICRPPETKIWPTSPQRIHMCRQRTVLITKQKRNWSIFIQAYAFKKRVCKLTVISFRSRYVSCAAVHAKIRPPPPYQPRSHQWGIRSGNGR